MQENQVAPKCESQPQDAAPDADAAAKMKAFAAAAGRGLLKPFINPLICVHALDSMIEKIKNNTPAGLFNVITGWMAKLGYLCMVVSAFLAIVLSLTAAVQEQKASLVFAGIGFLALLIILQYTAVKFMTAGEKMTSGMPTRLKSREFLDCAALILEITGLLLFIGFTIVAIDKQLWTPFWSGLGMMFICDMIAYVALHPDLACVSVSQNQSSGEEAIGIFLFFVKAFMRIVPVSFGMGQFVGTILLAICTVNLFRDEADIYNATGPVVTIIYTSLIPFAAYIIFCILCLATDLCRAILSLLKKDTIC